MAGMAYTGSFCNTYRNTRLINRNTAKLSANTGFITYKGNSQLGTSYLTFAHEVGHSLGAPHDGQNNSCSSSGFLMASKAPTRPKDDNKKFSKCSLRSIEAAIQDFYTVTTFMITKLLRPIPGQFQTLPGNGGQCNETSRRI